MARMIPIVTCLSLPEALVASSYLRDHGIMTALNGYHHASTAWFVLFALNGIQLSVLDSDLDRARDLLAGGSATAAGQEQPQAGGVAGHATLSEVLMAAAAFLLTGMPLPLWIRRRYVSWSKCQPFRV